MTNDIADANGALHSGDTGRFTGHLQRETDPAAVLPAPSVTSGALKARILDSFTVEEMSIGEASLQAAVERHPHDLEAAVTWLRRQGRVSYHTKLAEEAAERLQLARRMLIEHSVHACVQRILQSAPDAIKTVVYDGGDGATWSVQVPDGAIAEDWDEMGEDLEEMTTGQVLTDPYSLAPMCVGYNSATGGATGLVVNRHTRRLVEAEIDLAKLAGAKP